jgi:D-alanyl-D-alanine carboxypeptidase
MTARALLALLLILSHVPLAAGPRRRAVRHLEAAPVAPAAVVRAAREAAQNALAAGVPAVQIAVSHRGRVIYSEAFGMTDPERATAATPRSVMQVGSITKQFTAAAILRLADRGALSLDDRIEKFVPEFDPRGAAITLRHLLNHTSGVNAPLPYQYAPVTRAQFIASINAQPLASAPGSKWSYSGAGYKLLAYGIESITGRSFADFIHSEFALPLGLLDTGLCGTSNLPVPEGYDVFEGKWKRVPPVDMSVAFAAGGLCSTASDLVRWSHLLANGRVMLPASYATMTTATRLTNNTITPYGLGVSLEKFPGHPAVSHNGTIPGFYTFLVHFSDRDVAIAVVTNALPSPSAGNPQLIAVAVAHAALDALQEMK